MKLLKMTINKMMRGTGIIFLFLFFTPLYSQEVLFQDPSVKDYRFYLQSIPEIVLQVEFHRDTDIPVAVDGNNSFSIKEEINGRIQEIQPGVKILGTYTKEPVRESKDKFFTVGLDITKSLTGDEFEALKKAAREFLESIDGGKVALYKISGSAELIQNFTSKKERLLKKLDGIERKGKVTNLYDSLHKIILDTHRYQKKNNLEAGGIIIFTDGKEEKSVLGREDLEKLITHGTRYAIPVYFVFVNKKNVALEKLALTTGGKIFFLKDFREQMQSLFREPDNNDQDAVFIEKIEINYVSRMGILDILQQPVAVSSLYYRQNKIMTFSYSIPGSYVYAFYGALALGVLITVIITLLLFRRKRKLNIDVTSESKMDFPEPEFYYDDIIVDMRKYKDMPEKKYVESEGEPEVPWEVKTWNEPSYAPYLDDPKERKKFSFETMTLSLKEKSYVVLQMALKEAPRYSHAALLKKDREGLGYEKKYDIFLDEVYIGSSSAAHIPVRDPAVSPVHAKIKRIDQKFILFDLMSVTGTYLNGKKVLRPMPLRHNDEIRMGHTIFRFVGEN